MFLRLAPLLLLLALPAFAQSNSSDSLKTDDGASVPSNSLLARAAKLLAKSKTSAYSLKPDFADLSYGDHPNDKLDLWRAKSEKPAPLMIFIHGGGFVGGDKSQASEKIIKQCLDSGVSFASINYRFRTEASINVVLRDCARAVQFLRCHAAQYNLDKTRVVSFGGSAGAGASLWLAFRDDLADPQNPDPVLRESSRLLAAGANATQATYDVMRWHEILGEEAVQKFGANDDPAVFYGLKSREELESEQGKKLRADADMLGWISRDDPPVYMATNGHPGMENRGDFLHSPLHAQAVLKRCREIGVAGIFIKDNQPSDQGSMTDFLLKHLGANPKNIGGQQ